MFVFVTGTILNWQAEREKIRKDCSLPKKVPPSIKVDLKKNGKSCIPYLARQIHQENVTEPSADTLYDVTIKVKLMRSVTYEKLSIRRN